MKIGIVSDIHGNIIALKAILNHIKNENCDYIYFLGDTIAIGPFPKECIELILSLSNAKCVLGNHEEYFISGILDDSLYLMSEGEKKHQLWVASLLNDNIKENIRKFPYIINETIEGVRVSFLHYGLNNNTIKKTFKNIEKNITCETMDALFENIDADMIFYGHEHSRSNIKGKKHYINVGSSGCTKSNSTHYTTVVLDNYKYEITTNTINYDKEQVLKELNSRNVPEKEFIAKIFFNSNLS